MGKGRERREAANAARLAKQPVSTPKFAYAVSDEVGFVGVYSSIAQAIDHTAKQFPMNNFIYSIHRLNVSLPPVVYAVPRAGDNSLAFLSNDLEECKRRHKVMALVGYVFGEPEFKYWMIPLDNMTPMAELRLKRMREIVGNANAETSALERLIEEIDRVEAFEKRRLNSLAEAAAEAEDEAEKLTVGDESSHICIFSCIEPIAAYVADTSTTTDTHQNSTLGSTTVDPQLSSNSDVVNSQPSPDSVAKTISVVEEDGAELLKEE